MRSRDSHFCLDLVSALIIGAGTGWISPKTIFVHIQKYVQISKTEKPEEPKADMKKEKFVEAKCEQPYVFFIYKAL